MKKHSKLLTTLLALILVLAGISSAYAAIPEPSEGFYVADYADVITDETEQYIIEKNGDLEYYCDGAQIVIVTVDFLDGMDIEDYAYKLFNDWGIGASGSNNGVLLLLTIGEENYWCMAGKGLEGELTGGDLDELLWIYLEDSFAAEMYDLGVKSTFDQLCSEMYDIYNVTPSEGTSGGYNEDIYYEEELTTVDWIIALVVFAIIVIIIITIVCTIMGSIKSRRRRKTHYDPYVQPRPVVINPRPARKIYIPTVHHRPSQHTRPVTPPITFGGSFGGPSRPVSRPSTSRSFTSPGRSSFGSTKSSSSFGGGSSSRSRGIGRGGGGMSRGGGAGRRGR